jgi:hypothetical protein
LTITHPYCAPILSRDYKPRPLGAPPVREFRALALKAFANHL